MIWTAKRRGLTLITAWVLLACAAPIAAAAQLQKRTVEAFDRYVKQAEGHMDAELKAGQPFLWVDALPDAERASSYSRAHNGEVLVRELAAGAEVPGGMIHDWEAVAFIPNVTIEQTVSKLQDYNDDHRIYAPEVLHSRLLQRNGDYFSVLLRIKKKSFVTAVLDVTNDVRYTELDRARFTSRSYSTRIVEIEDPGTAQEHARPEGDDHGYLWRLYTYWRYVQKDGGTYIQCRAIALTRGIPYGLAWLIKPYVTKIPKESLLFTMTHARTAIEKEARTPKAASRR